MWCSYDLTLSFILLFSCDALCKLLLHAIATGDSRFEEIVVPDDEVGNEQGK